MPYGQGAYGQGTWPWPDPNNCHGCGATIKQRLCPRCSAEEAYRLADHAQRASELIHRCVHEEVDPLAYGSACADRDVALMLLSQQRRENSRLEARVGELWDQVSQLQEQLEKAQRQLENGGQ